MTSAELMTDAVARLVHWAAERPQAVLLVTRGREYTYDDALRRAAAAPLSRYSLSLLRRVRMLMPRSSAA